MIVYKLFRKLKDGSLAPLFINKKSRLPIGITLKAETHPTKGFTVRKVFLFYSYKVTLKSPPFKVGIVII